MVIKLGKVDDKDCIKISDDLSKVRCTSDFPRTGLTFPPSEHRRQSINSICEEVVRVTQLGCIEKQKGPFHQDRKYVTIMNATTSAMCYRNETKTASVSVISKPALTSRVST